MLGSRRGYWMPANHKTSEDPRDRAWREFKPDSWKTRINVCGFSYSLRFIELPHSREFYSRPGRACRRMQSQRFCQMPCVKESAFGPSRQVGTVTGGSGRHSLQCDVLQYLIAAGLALIGKPFRGVFRCFEDGSSRCRLRAYCRVEPSKERSQGAEDRPPLRPTGRCCNPFI